MQLYDITLTASQTRQLDAPGNYFYYYAGSAGGADATITLRGLSSGLRIILKPGQAFRLPQGAKENAWVMTNYAGTATIVGSVIVGDGDITDNRVTGSVEVIDGAKTRTLTGSAGIMSAASPVPGVGNYIQQGVWNPAGSGKRIIVNKLIFSSAQQQTIFMARIAAAATLSGVATMLFDGLAFTGVAKVSIYTGTTPTGQVIAGFGVQAGQASTLDLNEPIIIKPGYGLTCQTGNANSDLVTTIPFFEEADA
jgi:hypothetical protein